jgi:hypothetical protein
MIRFLLQKYNLIMKYKEKIKMAKFTELSAKDMNETNGGFVFPLIAMGALAVAIVGEVYSYCQNN